MYNRANSSFFYIHENTPLYSIILITKILALATLNILKFSLNCVVVADFTIPKAIINKQYIFCAHVNI